MDYILSVFFAFVCAIFFILLWRFFNRRVPSNSFDGTNPIKQSRAYFWVCLVGVLFCVAIQVYILFFQYDEWPVVFFFATFFALCFFGMLFFLNWRIEVGSDGFVLKNLFGVRRKYLFSETTMSFNALSFVFRKKSNGKRICYVSRFLENNLALPRAYDSFYGKKKQNFFFYGTKRDNVIRQPFAYVWLGFLVSSVFAFILVYAVAAKIKGWLYAFFTIPAIMYGVAVIMFSLNWKIEIHSDGFVFTNLFMIHKEYHFSDTKISFEERGTLVARIKENGKKICSVSMRQKNQTALFEAYLAYLRKNIVK